MVKIIDEECYVAFLDILGFKSIVLKKGYSEMKEIYDKIVTARAYVEDKVREISFEYLFLSQASTIRIMSDSIVIAVPKKELGAFNYICKCCIFFQRELGKNEIFLRGGISVGKFSNYDEITFGEGLVNAYILESEVAKFPRVVISLNIDITQINNNKYKNLIHRDEKDELYYLNFMSQSEIGQYKDICDKNIKKYETNLGIKEKYVWLKKNARGFE